jgi:type II secretory pathway pseudopilin PulG
VLELLVAVAIISIMMALAVPTFQRIQQRTTAASIVNDFRVFAEGFQSYAIEHGIYPAEASAGVIPAGMSGRLSATAWTRRTAMGGNYNWENNQMQLYGFRPKAAIAISSNPGAGNPLTLDSTTVNLLFALDLIIDNEIGGWNSGSFRLSGSLLPLFVIEP